MNGLEAKRVLVVDDDKFSCDLAEMFLEGVGISRENVVIAKNGYEAVEIAKKELFDLILMDLRMPGMDGVQATQEIKNHYNGDSPKIFAYTSDQFVNKINGSELFDDFLVKPVNMHNFKRKILDALNTVGENVSMN